MPGTSEATSLWITLALYGVAIVNLALAAIVAHPGNTRPDEARRGISRVRGMGTEKREANRVFALTLLCVALWALSNAQFRQAATIPLATLWAQISYLPALLTAAYFFHFSRVYPRRSPLSIRGKAVLYLMALGIGALAFVPDLMVHEVVQDGGGRRLLTGSGLTLVALYMLITSVLAFARFWRNQRRSRGRAQAQSRYVLFGSALTALIGLWFNLLLPLFGDYRWVWLGPVGSLFVVGFTVYSIVTQKLFDVRILIRRTVVTTIYLAVFAGAFAALGKALEYLVSPFLGGDDSYVTGVVTALLVGFALDPLKRHLHKLASQRLFQGEPVADREQVDD